MQVTLSTTKNNHSTVNCCLELSLLVCILYIRVVRGDINFWISTDPLNFWLLMDQNRPYLTKFWIENESFLLTKPHVFVANWTERLLTSKAYFGHLLLWKGVWNLSRVNKLALTIPKMVWKKSNRTKNVTELWKLLTFTNPSSGGDGRMRGQSTKPYSGRHYSGFWKLVIFKAL